METTRLSSKGQVIIPHSIRLAHKWSAGVEFAVIETDKGILLSPIKSFKPTSIKEIIGCVGYKGPKKSLKNMEQGLAKGARKRK